MIFSGKEFFCERYLVELNQCVELTELMAAQIESMKGIFVVCVALNMLETKESSTNLFSFVDNHFGLDTSVHATQDKCLQQLYGL